MPDLSLDGRVAIVTGGGSGLGRGFAETLAGAGAKVAVTGRRSEPLAETVARIEAKGGAALAVPCDQRSREQVDVAVAQTAAWGGSVDVLVNCAAIYPPATILDVPEEEWVDVIDTNLNGPFRFSQACARHMVANGWGRIVNILSPSGLLGFGLVGAYGSSKGGLLSLTRCLAAELSGVGVTANALVPGVSATEAFLGMFTEVGVELFAKQLPIKRACTDDDLAATLLVLASDAGSYITGAVFPVDGGMTSVFPMGL